MKLMLRLIDTLHSCSVPGYFGRSGFAVSLTSQLDVIG